MVGVVVFYPEGARVQETESLFELVQSDVAVFEGKGYEVILIGDFKSRIGLGEETVKGEGSKIYYVMEDLL